MDSNVSNITNYDYTKDINYLKLEHLVYDSLILLGFNINVFGTKLLKDLILYAYYNQTYDLFFDNLVYEFFNYKVINNISLDNATHRITYAILNTRSTCFKDNFSKVFNTQYDYYYETPKNLIILFLNLLNSNNLS